MILHPKKIREKKSSKNHPLLSSVSVPSSCIQKPTPLSLSSLLPSKNNFESSSLRRRTAESQSSLKGGGINNNLPPPKKKLLILS